jgi:hypothetical protein
MAAALRRAMWFESPDSLLCEKRPFAVVLGAAFLLLLFVPQFTVEFATSTVVIPFDPS